MRSGKVVHDRLITLITVLRMLFLFSQNVPDREIISRMKVGQIRSAPAILNRFRQVVDEEIVKLSDDSDTDVLRQQFFGSEEIDHFGFIILWASRFES